MGKNNLVEKHSPANTLEITRRFKEEKLGMVRPQLPLAL